LPHLGGVERYVDKLSGALTKLGYEIVIITSRDDVQDSYEKKAAYSIYRLPIQNLAKNRYPIPKINSEYRALIKKLKDEKLDYFIVNTRFYPISLIGAKLGRQAGKPVLLIEHGTDHFTVGNAFFDFFGLIYEHALTWYVKRFVDKFYGVSKSCSTWLKHFSIPASGVFYNAIDPNDKQNVANDYARRYPNDEIVITYAGRLIKEKGILNLLEAFTKVQAENQSIQLKLAIAGNGELLDIIKKDYKNRDIDILGKLNRGEMMALYKRTDIFVHPSLYPEGLPTSILEAGLMGCAIIATPRGGTEEVIIDRKHGKIIDGSVQSLHDALVELIHHPDDRKSYGTNVQHRVEANFTWDTVAKQVDTAIKGFGSQPSWKKSM
jgi:glycosyltransferase involved in cell wall biosynthesis